MDLDFFENEIVVTFWYLGLNYGHNWTYDKTIYIWSFVYIKGL